VKNILIILNPAAHSDKAGRLPERIREISGDVEMRMSTMPGAAEQIARNAVA